MSVYEIPLQPATAQTFQVQLAGVSYNMTLKWNDPNNTWVLDIYDLTKAPMVTGVPLVAGVDLLAPYAYMNFGGKLIVNNDSSNPAPASFASLGVSTHLYFVTPQ